MGTQSAAPATSTRLGEALAAIARGDMVLVADDADRENEGDLVMAAEHIDTADMVFFLRHGSGIICTPMSEAIADGLGLDPMVTTNTDSHQTAFTVSADFATVGTGISAADRAATVRALGCAATTPDDLRRPGHIFPLRAKAGGVLERRGHTEAAIDLLRLAGCRQVAVITELVADNGVPLSGAELTAFAAAHKLAMVTIGELAQHRRSTEPSRSVSEPAAIPTDHGLFSARAYVDEDGVEHLVLTLGNVQEASTADAGVLVRVHSECLTGDVIGSRRCDCGSQLDTALALIASEGAGILVYLRGHEGRGIGLSDKLAAYVLQERGRDTVDANVDLGVPVDNRDYSAAAALLHTLGVHRIRLITNNPAKVAALCARGVAITETVPSAGEVNKDNIGYLRTKRDRMGHRLDLPFALSEH